LLNAPRKELTSENEITESENELKAVSFVGAFRNLMEVLRDFYIRDEEVSRIILVGGSSFLYFVRPIIREVLGIDDMPNEEELGEKQTKDTLISSAFEPVKAVARGAAKYEYMRWQKESNIKTKLFYDLQLQGDPPITILAADDNRNSGIPMKGISIKKQLNMVITDDWPSNKPIILALSRSGGRVNDKIRKEIQHDVPICATDVIEFTFNVSVDGIISVKTKNYYEKINFPIIENYPIIHEEGLKVKINEFCNRFPGFADNKLGGEDASGT
jgi:molecular chaperone DnaK (HSP70)